MNPYVLFGGFGVVAIMFLIAHLIDRHIFHQLATNGWGRAKNGKTTLDNAKWWNNFTYRLRLTGVVIIFGLGFVQLHILMTGGLF